MFVGHGVCTLHSVGSPAVLRVDMDDAACRGDATGRGWLAYAVSLSLVVNGGSAMWGWLSLGVVCAEDLGVGGTEWAGLGL